jgi:hypothetical protein
MSERIGGTPFDPAGGRRYVNLALVVVACSFAATLLLRVDLFMERVGAPGVEATYHVLWTARALTESDASAHLYLPTVTLNPDPENSISWGATVPTPGGAFIYTSFPPLGLLLFTAILQIAGTASFLALSLANAALGLVAALAMGALARDAALSFGPASLIATAWAGSSSHSARSHISSCRKPWSAKARWSGRIRGPRSH